MRPTIPFLEQRFAQFNEQMFGGQLPPVRLRLSRARTYMGQLRWHRRAPRDITLSISTLYDLPQAEVEDTLLHEMIHLHILVSGQRDTSTHGALFRAKMRGFNEEFGRHITVSHRLTEQQREQDTKVRRHYVCVSRLRDGRTGITVATPASIAMLWRNIPRLPEVVEAKWYLTTDSYFNRFRRSRTVKVYLADPAALADHLASARPLVREGGRIFAARASQLSP